MSSVLRGGSQRRRFGRPLAIGVGAAVTLAVVVVAWLALTGDRSLLVPLGALQGSSDPKTGKVRPPAPGAVSLAGEDAFRVRFRNPPRAGLVFDLRTGEVLWRRRPRSRFPIASLTKIMTALLVAELTSPREQVRIDFDALLYQGSGVGRLPEGRRVPIDALLHGLMLVSGNDAAIALADHVARSEIRFVRMMNRRARQLRLGCTRFVSSHGLEAGNRSCVADLAALTRLAMRQRRIAAAVRKREAALRFPIRGGRLFLNNTNPLLRSRYPGTIGLKTGYTAPAGRCFVAVVRRRGRTLGVVLLGSPNPSAQARRLLGAAFRRR